MVARSRGTLEVASFDIGIFGSLEETNPFHIGTETSWTTCTRLKELVLHRSGGSPMTDYRWNLSHPFSDAETIRDYSTVFGQLERLQLAIKETHWQECPQPGEGGDGYDSWDEDRGDDEEGWGSSGLDEEDDDVRELFGRIKDLKQLQVLEIEWSVSSSIENMSLEYALELFGETEVVDDSQSDRSFIHGSNNSAFTRTLRGWWSKVTKEDLCWLCLPWPSRPVVERTKVGSTLIMASARQDESKSPQLDDDDERYNQRVSRVWKDWNYVASGCH
ncbi:hypothetical protein BGX23_001847, partial [Mortierella sp. AD031]